MKNFIIWTLALIITAIGCICFGLYSGLDSFEWYHLFLLIGSMLTVSPALAWWHNFFKEVLK